MSLFSVFKTWTAVSKSAVSYFHSSVITPALSVKRFYLSCCFPLPFPADPRLRAQPFEIKFSVDCFALRSFPMFIDSSLILPTPSVLVLLISRLLPSTYRTAVFCHGFWSVACPLGQHCCCHIGILMGLGVWYWYIMDLCSRCFVVMMPLKLQG